MYSLPTSTQAVVFDCDGLLVNTEDCWTVAEAAIFAAHGHSFGPEEKALVIGRTVEASGEAMAE
uniref:HAD family phosphatase n=1 Tax=Streptomyces sp. NBC_00003 TaxID=2903608 RepID=A0AAU2VG17_9ACTN